MPKLTIDQSQVEVPGATVLDAARKLGIDIPALCFREGCKPSTSCLACVVRAGRPRAARALVCHGGGRGNAGRERDRGGASGPPHRAGIALERSPGRLRGAVPVRLPGADGRPHDAAADRRGPTAGGHRHGETRHCPAGHAGSNLPGALRKGLPPRGPRSGRLDLPVEAVGRRRGSGLRRTLSTGLQACHRQAGGNRGGGARGTGGRLLSCSSWATPARFWTRTLRRAGGCSARPRKATCLARCCKRKSRRSRGWESTCSWETTWGRTRRSASYAPASTPCCWPAARTAPNRPQAGDWR